MGYRYRQSASAAEAVAMLKEIRKDAEVAADHADQMQEFYMVAALMAKTAGCFPTTRYRVC